MGAAHSLAMSLYSPDPTQNGAPAEPGTHNSLSVSPKRQYFITPAPVILTHDHPMRASTASAIEAAVRSACPSLPADIVQTILDLAEVWTACTRGNRRHLSVQAGGSEPHGQRGVDWVTGQEGELGQAEKAGLEDDRGRVWYLVSAPLGCTACDGESTSDLILEDRKLLRERDLPSVFIDKPAWGNGAAMEGGGHVAAPMLRQENGGKKWWARRIVIETYSRDQGWTPVDEWYGRVVEGLSWFELSILRDGKELDGSRHIVLNNVVAGQYYKSYHVELDSSHPVVQAAREGDRFVLWVCASEAGSMNRVRRATMTVYAAPFPPLTG